MADENKNALEMSDEDFLNADIDAFEEPLDEADETESTDESDQETETAETKTQEANVPEADESEDEEVDNEESDESSMDESDSEEDASEDEEEEAPADKQPEQPADEIDYAAIGRQVMAEFKANGTTIKMKSGDDVIRLMQMGANYHKKMAGLKPSLKTLKLLENNDLLDPDKINYLIDLSQKKPEAIKQLLKDSKLDPMEIDLDDESSYTPVNRTVNDKELYLDEILDSISSSPSYDKTLTVLGDDWDETSRRAIADNPDIIRTINLHMDNGIYDQVAQAVNYERSLGNLVGVSDLEAYQRVGAYMNENNMFKSSTGAPQVNSTQNRQEAPVQDTQKDQQRKQRKKAASPSRQRQTPTKGKDNYNPLAMSDEEFMKLNDLQL